MTCCLTIPSSCQANGQCDHQQILVHGKCSKYQKRQKFCWGILTSCWWQDMVGHVDITCGMGGCYWTVWQSSRTAQRASPDLSIAQGTSYGLGKMVRFFFSWITMQFDLHNNKIQCLLRFFTNLCLIHEGCTKHCNKPNITCLLIKVV